MLNFFKKDSWLLGLLAGVIVPLFFYGIFYFINSQLAKSHGGIPYLKNSTVQLICLFLNVLMLRLVFVNAKYEKTGRAILVVTFGYAIYLFFFAFKL